MRNTPLALSGWIFVIGLAGLLRAAESAAPEAGRPAIAVLDLAEVLKNHPEFKSQMIALKADTARAEAALTRQRDELVRRSRDLEGLRAGTPEHKALQEELARRQADLTAALELQRKEFVRREAGIYHACWTQVAKVVDRYAREHHLSVVLRSDRGAVNANDPSEVVRGLNRQLLWSAEGLDITADIVALVAKTGTQPAKDRTADAKAEKEPAGAAAGKGPIAKSDATKEAKPVKKATAVRIVLRGDFPEAASAMSLFGEVQPSLSSVIRRLDRAAEDKNIAAVLLEFDDAEVGAGKVNELRAAIGRVRKAGKPIAALLSGAETNEYLVAAACDEIVLAPSGALVVPGVRAEMTFYKGLLEKIGLQYDVLQMGKYKGAAETFTRTGMSPDLRESMKALVDDSYESLVATIAKDRKLEAAEVKRLIDQGLFTAPCAQKARLVDHALYFDEYQEVLRKRLGVDSLNVSTEAKKRSEGELSGMSGMMKLMELALGSKQPEKTSQGRKIAVIYAVGMIIEGESATSIFGGQALGSTTLIAALRSAAEDPKVLAIVLRIDSPGGSAVASDLIWREVRKIKKPVIASMGDVAASGGYYIAMGAGQVFAEPGTVTGSIGVVGGKLVTGGLYDKVGITTDVISRGRNSGSLSSTHPFTKDERAAWTGLLEETYRQFVDKAAQGRKMPREKLESLAQGRVYTGRMAAVNGLVDKLGTLADAIAEAKKIAGVKAEEKVELLILPKPKSIFEQLFNEPSVISERLAAELPGGRKALARVQVLRRLAAEKVLAVMPLVVELK